MPESENRLFDLTGKTALITGSGGGLGFAIARGLGQAGATLVLNGRDEQKLDAAVRTLRSEGLSVSGYAFDITDADALEPTVERIEREVGPIDVLVNNAGLQRRGPLETISVDDWRAVIETNLTGAFLMAQPVARRMIGRGRGKIINICSLMSEVGRPTIGPYTASKGGLKNLTKAMALEWGSHNLQCNGIGPGYFATEMTRSLKDDPDFNGWITGRTPQGRWGKPEELVGPAVFLASDASSYVNGQVLYVDGGILSTL
ncbi:MAG: SDR family oxidoreductase [Planctomycetota bacterium]